MPWSVTLRCLTYPGDVCKTSRVRVITPFRRILIGVIAVESTLPVLSPILAIGKQSACHRVHAFACNDEGRELTEGGVKDLRFLNPVGRHFFEPAIVHQSVSSHDGCLFQSVLQGLQFTLAGNFNLNRHPSYGGQQLLVHAHHIIHCF